MSLAASILFDPGYIEPALVTAFELFERQNRIERLHLILVRRGDADDIEQAVGLLQAFCAQFAERRPAPNAIVVENVLPEVTSHHFNNTILFKLLVPALLPGEDYVLNLDAGVLIGRRFEGFLERLQADLCSGADEDWVMAAHCSPMTDNLPETVRGLPHHPLYPAGILMAFNRARYQANQWQARLLETYQRLAPHLVYAEEELVCLVARDAELRQLPGDASFIRRFLGVEPMLDESKRRTVPADGDYLYYKDLGSMKPWKYWVLDPGKALYLRRRAALEASFPLDSAALVQKHRLTAPRPDWPEGFLRAYEAFLIHSDFETR